MKFSEKLKKLRQDNNFTQDELAEKLFVTRTAISKWETDKGYPSIDSLKMISDLFKISIDDLISNEDIENKKTIEKYRARKIYYLAIGCLALTMLFAVLTYKIKYLSIPTLICMIAYLICAFMFKRKNDVIYDRKAKVYIIIRIVLIVIISIITFTFTMYTIL